MLVVMQQGATEEQIEHVIGRLVDLGFDVHRSTGLIHTVLGGVGGRYDFDLAVFQVMEGVKEAHRIVSPYKLASRSFRPGGHCREGGLARNRRRCDRRDGRSEQRWKTGTKSSNAPNWQPVTARKSSAAERSNRGVRRMSFRASAPKAFKCSGPPPTATACW